MKKNHSYLSILFLLLLLIYFQPAFAAPIQLTLDTSIAMALDTNSTIKMAQAGKEKSIWNVNQAKAGKGLTI